MKKLLFICLGLLSMSNYAQTDPIFFNANNFNPAFVGTKENLSVGVNYFVGHIDDTNFSSKVFAANVYTAISHKFGIGLTFSNLNYDVIKEKNLHLYLSYKYDFSKVMSLSFGTSVGFTKLKTNFTELLLPDGNIGSDDTLDNANKNNTDYQYGLGLYYTYKKLQFGLSIPNLNKKKIEGVDVSNDFVISGFFEQPLSEKAKLEFGAYYIVSNYDNQFYLSANTTIKNIIGAGINYKRDVFGIQLSSPKIADLFVVGLRFDFASNKYYSDYNNLMLFGNLETKPIFN